MARRAFLGLPGIGTAAFAATVRVAPLTVRTDTPSVDSLGRFALAVPDGWTPQRQTAPEILGIWSADNGAASFTTVVYTPP